MPTSSSEPADIQSTFSYHLAALFRTQGVSEREDFEEAVGSFCRPLPQLPEDACAALTGPGTRQELEESLRAMSHTTAPGPDGLLAGFYVTFFGVVGGLLLTLVNPLLPGGAKPPSFGLGRIVLLLKEGITPSSPSSWRLITLLNTDYRLVATLLLRRLRAHLHDLLSPYQTCAVQGRSVFASLVLTRDVFEYASAKRVSGAFVSLDKAKAFDCVEHGYLFAVLRWFGLLASFIELVRPLYADLTRELLFNGSIVGSFPVTRGVRQGCPLSPALFVLTLDPLLRRTVSDMRICGFLMIEQDPDVVSAYADDISVFVRDADSFRVFLHIFHQCALRSGA